MKKTEQEILSIFYKNYNYYYDDGNWKCDFMPELYKGLKLIYDIIFNDNSNQINASYLTYNYNDAVIPPSK